MFKSNFFKATVILLIGGFISKLLGFILKIIMTRMIGLEGISLYSLIMPTFGLLSTIAIFSFPVAIGKIVAEEKGRIKNIFTSIIPISIMINIFMIILVYLFAPLISENLLKEPKTYYPIIAISLTMPFIGLSSIIKGYFWGKQTMFPYILSNIAEQIVRLSLLIFLIPYTLKISVVTTITVVILVNVVSETVSIIIMLLFMPKGVKIKKEDIKVNKNYIKDILEVSVPSTSSKVVGCIFFFFEPIILTNTLLYVGYSHEFIINEYGILNGYSLSLLLLPQFFAQSISTSLVPEISKNYKLGDKKKCIKRIKQIVLLSVSIGFITSLFIFLFPEFLLDLLFHKVYGVNYLRFLSFFMLLYFIDLPFISALQSLNKSKENMYITIIGSSIKLLLIFLLSLLKIGIYGLIISIVINLLIVTYLNYKTLKKYLS